MRSGSEVTVQDSSRILVIACGALAREIQALKSLNDWHHIELTCLDAELHNRPDQIVPKLREKLDVYREKYEHIFVGYADCGTGGALDRLLEEENIPRLPGAHCYAFYAGQEEFSDMAAAELGTFYLTDFLARHFERLIVSGMGLDRHPEIRDMMFSHYRRLVYLSQRFDAELLERAERAAAYLELPLEHRHTGYGELESSLREQVIAIA